MKHWFSSIFSIALLTTGVIAGSLGAASQAQAQNTRVFEMRTYHTHEG